ncbi:MAG: peroxidase [Calditrichaeota bacterium]|nr:MAG: peroxidase [Calditrichota bacterium]
MLETIVKDEIVNLNDRQKAIISYTEKLTKTPADMLQEDLLPLKSVGLNDKDILDLAFVVSYFNFINRIADGLGVELEESYKQFESFYQC